MRDFIKQALTKTVQIRTAHGDTQQLDIPPTKHCNRFHRHHSDLQTAQSAKNWVEEHWGDSESVGVVQMLLCQNLGFQQHLSSLKLGGNQPLSVQLSSSFEPLRRRHLNLTTAAHMPAQKDHRALAWKTLASEQTVTDTVLKW
jgi:hypothetical protein